MYTIAVCDDESSAMKYIADSVRERFEQQRISVAVDQYGSSKHLLERLDQNTCYDILLMDIDMPGMNGIDICRRFRRQGGEALVVFISNKEEMVFQTFDVQPFRFVRKSRFTKEIDPLVHDLISELERRNDRWLRFDNEVDGTVISINIRQLMYVEARGKYCRMKETNHENEMKIKFQVLQNKLAEYSFIQVHRSYLVNPSFIYRIDQDTLLLDNDEVIPISRRRRNQIKEEYFQWSRT